MQTVMFLRDLDESDRLRTRMHQGVAIWTEFFTGQVSEGPGVEML